MRFLELIQEAVKGELPTPNAYTVRDLVLLYGRGMSDIEMARHVFPTLQAPGLEMKRATLSKHVIAIRHAIDAAMDSGSLPALSDRVGVTENELLLMIGSRPRPNLSAAARHIANTNRSGSWSEMESLLRQWAIENDKVCHPNSVSKAIQVARKEAGLGKRRTEREPSRGTPFDPAAKYRAD